MTAYKGRCLCGAVTLNADGPPESVVACHCVSCRRFSGTPVTVYADYNRERIQFTGEEATECETSPGSYRGFCGRCGSSIYFRGENLPDMIHLLTGVFDKPENFVPAMQEHDETRLPFIHLYLKEK